MKRSLLLLAFLFSSFFGWTQILDLKAFTPDSTQYFEEMKDFFWSVDGRRKDAKEIIEAFEEVWYGGKFSDEERKSVYKTSNFMLKFRMKPFPEFQAYLLSLLSLKKSEKNSESFEVWQYALDNLVQNAKRSDYVKFLLFSGALFDKNALYSSRSTEWTSNNTNYEFSFDGDQPILICPSLNLKCEAKGDSSVIYDTKGTYYILESLWKGEGGMLYWDRCEFNRDSVNAKLSTYQIELKSSLFDAENVEFTNLIYFDRTLKGVVSEKLLANMTPERASYPRFKSYENIFEIKDLSPGVDYVGGFEQRGSKFIGSGDADNPATLVFYKDNVPFIKAFSNSFLIRTDRIASTKTRINIYLTEEDSITHPGLDMRYLLKDNFLTFIRTDEGVARTPFFDTYHKIDLTFDALYWKIGDPKIEFGALKGATVKRASFESENYYDEGRFDKYIGVGNTHPFYIIKKAVEHYNSDVLADWEVAKFWGVSRSGARSILMLIATEGFLDYDYEKHTIRVKEKLIHFLESKSKLRDYDVIRIDSDVDEGYNASLNLLNLDLDIKGINYIQLSDSHRVFIFPYDKSITMKRNRDFTFSGVINAGKIEYFGKDFAFTYDDFKIDMAEIDSMRLIATTGNLDEKGQPEKVRVRTTIEDLTGDLRIDKPDNKSGLQDNPEYPIFRSFQESYAYYDKGNKAGKVYPRDQFHFKLEPFTFDSLDNFTNAGINFKGTFTSAGIFPDIDESLTLQKDYSLGFDYKIPPEGMPAYGGKGKITGDMNLSNNGLQSSGVLEYLTSTTESESFLYFPDSMNCIAQQFVLEEVPAGIEYPPANGKNLKVHWRPYKDFMIDKVLTSNISLYDGRYEHVGYTTLTPEGYYGSGHTDFSGAQLHSKKTKFLFTKFTADTANFNLTNIDSTTQAKTEGLNTENVNALVDIVERKAELTSNTGGSPTNFPENKYFALIDKFIWWMDKGDIELSGSEANLEGVAAELNLEGAKFTSTHPDQDSLNFYSKRAIYNNFRKIIYAKEVKAILVADAIIYPDSGYVTVRRNANMDPLENSTIVANSNTKYHTIYEATTNIKASKRYTSIGKYDYKTADKKVQTVYLDNIYADSTGQTVGEGSIPNDLEFTLSPQYNYYGKVKLLASNKNLNFNGNLQINHSCEALPREFFKFDAEIDPYEIYIPFDTSSVRNDDKPLVAGFQITNDSSHIYPAFISKPKKYSDNEMIYPSGFLFFDEDKNEFKISSAEKLIQQSLPGNYLSLGVNNCDLYGEGQLNFGVDLGRIEYNMAGSMKQNTVEQHVTMDVMILFDFFFDEKLMSFIAKDIEEATSLDAVRTDQDKYIKGLQEIIGKEEADKQISSMQLYGTMKKFPDQLNKPLFINDIQLEWDQESSSFMNTGKIGLGNLYKDQLNKKLEGRFQIVKKRTGDIWHLYLEVSGSKWYYFNYFRGVLNVVSSNDEFNTYLKELKSDKRKLKNEKGKSPYQFMLTSTAKKDLFLKRLSNVE